MRRLSAVLALAATLTAQVAYAQVSRPRNTATPKPDQTAGHLGVPRPSAAPPCGDGAAFFYGDPVGDKGCIYACTDGRTTIVAGVSCALPTAAATVALTPTPTATATATLSPTPTVTVTP